MRFGAALVVRCEVVLVEEDDRLEFLDEHVVALMATQTPRNRLHTADVVGIPGTDGMSAPETFDQLPGCLMVVDLTDTTVLHVRGGREPVVMPDGRITGPATALLHSWPRAWGGVEAVTKALRNNELSVGPCTENGPTATVFVRLRGRTILCRWTTPL